MHFDRYGDVSRIIYATIRNSRSQPDFSLPEIEEEEGVGGGGGDHHQEQPQLVKQRSSSTGNISRTPEKKGVGVAEPQSGTLNHYSEIKKNKANKKVESSSGIIRDEEECLREQEEKKQVLSGGVVSFKQPENIDEIVAAVSAEYDRKEEEMKDLDRLVNDLLQEASQIPDIPYHARPDGGPFRYCPEDDIVGRGKLIGNKSSPFQPTSSSTPKPSKVYEIKSSWPDVKVEEPSEYLPKNWSSNNNSSNVNNNSSASPSALQAWPNASGSLSPPDDGSSWNKVRVEHEPSPKNWTRIPVNTSRSSTDHSSSSHHHHHHHHQQQQHQDSVEIPIVRERSSRRDEWESAPVSARDYTSRDWDVFEQVKEREKELEDWVRSEGRRTPKRQPVKYSRSVSADHFSEQGSEEWLAKQMAKLQLKRTGSIRQSNPLRPIQPEASSETPAWLAELKQRNSIIKNSSSSSISNISTTKEIPVQVISTQQSSSTTAVAPSFSSRVEASSTPNSGAEVPTPRFPACPPTPYMNKSGARRAESRVHRVDSNKTYFSPRSAPVTDEDTEDEEEIAKIMFSNRRPDDDLKFTVDTSCNWYKPSATREEAISALAHRFPGTFIIRNSNSFPGAYGLAIKVDDYNVRHFLIEPTRAGVRLRGSAIEPVFGSLSALVYAHTIQPLALPVKLHLHSEDNLIPTSLSQSTTSKLLSQGAACQLLFLGSNNVEMLTGVEAIQRSVSKFITNRPTLVNLRLSKSGLVLTDVMRESFFRNHHPLPSIIDAGVDPLNRFITLHGKLCKLFGIVVTSSKHNSVLVLSEFEEGQPAVAIVAFILRVIHWRSL